VIAQKAGTDHRTTKGGGSISHCEADFGDNDGQQWEAIAVARTLHDMSGL
jgi:hypothetical protein